MTPEDERVAGAPDVEPGSTPGGEARLAPLLSAALLLKLLMLLVLVAAAAHYPAEPGYTAPREGDANDVVWYLARGFDAHAYQRLAREGYTDAFSRNYPLGFPLLIRAAAWVTGNGQTAAVLVANACGIAAVALFFVLARAYGRRLAVSPTPAVLLFAATPGVLVYGTVAYSESSFLVASLAAWWAWLRAEQGGPEPLVGRRPSLARGQPLADLERPPRSLAWLALASLLFGLAASIRHLGAALLVGLVLVEGARVLAPRGLTRGRALLEALAACWSGLPLAAYFLWKFASHDLAGLQQEIWSMRFLPLGGPASLVALGTAPEYVAQVYVTLPLALLLLVRLAAVDRRLCVLSVAVLVVALSFTGVAAQSTTRYVWALWPLSLGALAIRDRAVVWAIAGVLVFVSAWCGVGHVLGTAAF